MEFKDKVAIITGSGSGIGKVTAIELGKLGAKIMLNGRNEDKLINTKKELIGLGINVEYCCASIQTIEGANLLVETAIAKFGKIDILITNAGISMRASFDTMDAEHFKSVMDANIYGTVFPAKAALPHLVKSGGSLVFISSLAGIYGLPSASAYSAGKMALTALTQSLRAELRNTSIHIGIVYVGFTQNDDTKRVLNAKGEEVPVAHRPGGMQQTQQQVALSIIELIRKRKHKIILSTMGKLMSFLVKVAPKIVDKVLENSQKKMAKMLE
ncbi:MAG: SDR family oxidoreductase [Bacteroidetes bacterium]|nr:SDR family oxidoreductase [Bacteroidota bacterium]